MPIITLTSDLGPKDFYVPALKAQLLGQIPNTHVVDISHTVKPFHFLEAAYLLTNCFREFAAGTIHIIGVEGDFSRRPEFIIAEVEGHIFITKNTGILSLISSEKPSWVYAYSITDAKDLKSPLIKILGKMAIEYANGKALESFGTKLENLPARLLVEPQQTASTLTGAVVFVNFHKNVITNIHRRHFEAFSHFESCRINYSRSDYFNKIFNSYYDVPEGEVACFFSSNGFLEIGIHGGNASELLTLYEGKSIFIEFE